MRAFRPSRFASLEDYEEDHQADKDVNVQRYAKRAEAGMPLFDGARAMGDLSARSSDSLGRE